LELRWPFLSSHFFNTNSDEYSQQKYALEFWEQRKAKKETKTRNKLRQQEKQILSMVEGLSSESKQENALKETLRRKRILSPSLQKQRQKQNVRRNELNTSNISKSTRTTGTSGHSIKKIEQSSKRKKPRHSPKEVLQSLIDDQLCRYDTMTIFSRRHFHEQLRRHAVNQASKILQHGFQFDPVDEVADYKKAVRSIRTLDTIFKEKINTYGATASIHDFENVIRNNQKQENGQTSSNISQSMLTKCTENCV
jgi:predicted esterase YcpF (UPF0227 family)